MALGRNHVLVIVAIVGIIALTLTGAGLFSVTQETGYVRINVSAKSAVYLEFKGTQLRAAASAGGLRNAEPVALRARQTYWVESPEFTLPIPADQLPEGVGAVKGKFTRIGNVIDGQLGICRTDEQKAVWQCDVAVYAHGAGQPREHLLVIPDSEAALPVGAAQVIEFPRVEKLAMVVTGVPSKGNLGVGVGLRAGDDQVRALRKDGEAVLLQVRVTDAAGKEVDAKKGPLSDFALT